MSARPKIGILETGRPPEELAKRFDDYPGMVRHWLGDLDADYVVYPVLDGELPEDPHEADLWVITGSRFAAYEDHPWIAPLEAFIRACRDAGAVMFGICFGHQIIAKALGGTVEKSSKGWGLGVHDYSIRNWPGELGAEPSNLAMQAFHQDQVIQRPEGASTVAGSEFCEHAVLWYPGFAFTVQGHPEYDSNFARELIEHRRGTAFTSDVANAGLENVRRDDHAEFLAKLVQSAVTRARKRGSGPRSGAAA